jgi:hypothetical protein
MGRKQKNILAAILVFFLLVEYISIIFLKEGKDFSIIGETEVLQKPQEKELEKGYFSGLPCENIHTRAFGIVLSQSPETMPLSGVSQAEIALEGPVANPGGVTRILTIFQCSSPKEIGSIRSVRPYMVDLALGFDVILASWGGANAAVQRIRDLNVDWLDARVNPSGAFFRKRNIPAPHNGFASFEGLKKAAKNLGMRQENQFEGYQFLNENEVVLDTNPQEININYYYPVKYVYDLETGSYLRFWNGQEMIDRNTSKQVQARNVVLMKTNIGILSAGVANVKVVGEGEARIFQAGREIKGTWKKESSEGRLAFFDENDKEIKFVPGSIWIEIVEKF